MDHINTLNRYVRREQLHPKPIFYLQPVQMMYKLLMQLPHHPLMVHKLQHCIDKIMQHIQQRLILARRLIPKLYVNIVLESYYRYYAMLKVEQCMASVFRYKNNLQNLSEVVVAVTVIVNVIVVAVVSGLSDLRWVNANVSDTMIINIITITDIQMSALAKYWFTLHINMRSIIALFRLVGKEHTVSWSEELWFTKVNKAHCSSWKEDPINWVRS